MQFLNLVAVIWLMSLNLKYLSAPCSSSSSSSSLLFFCPRSRDRGFIHSFIRASVAWTLFFSLSWSPNWIEIALDFPRSFSNLGIISQIFVWKTPIYIYFHGKCPQKILSFGILFLFLIFLIISSLIHTYDSLGLIYFDFN